MELGRRRQTDDGPERATILTSRQAANLIFAAFTRPEP